MKALIQVKESRGKPASGGRASRAWLSAPERAKLTVEVVGRRPPARVRQTPSKDVGAAAAQEPVATAAATQGFDLANISLGQPGAPAPIPEAPAGPETAPPTPEAAGEEPSAVIDEGAAAEMPAEEAAEKEIPKAPATPDEDPAFQEAKLQVKTEAKKQKRHDTPEKKRIETEDASALSVDEQKDQSAKVQNTKEMGQITEQQGAEHKSSAEQFKKDLKGRIAQQLEKNAPKSESKAKAFAKDPPIQFEPEFSNKVDAEQDKVINPIQEKAAPNPTGGVVEKTEKPIPNPVYPSPPKPVDPQLVTPKPRTDEEISLQHESDRLDDVMADNRLSDEQLAESREPQFIETLHTKQKAQQMVAEAPAQYRQKEEEILSNVTTQSDQSLSTELEGMKKVRGRSGGTVHKGQKDTETKTEARQKDIKKTIDGITSQTIEDVGTILKGMAEKVKKDFADCLKQKTEIFNETVRSSISEYYGDWRIDDEMFGPSPVQVLDDGSIRKVSMLDIMEMKARGQEVELINPNVYRIFLREKNNFVVAMNEAIDNVSLEVEKGLNEARARIRKGEDDIATFKRTLKGEELVFADQLEQEARMKFQSLEGSIDDAREDLLQSLADQYVENVGQLKKTFTDINNELKKSWLDRAIEFIETVAKTIFQLAELLFTILVRVAYLVWDIIKHPIRFFETLVSGLMQGIGTFIDNIGTYLEEAFWTWITNASPAKSIRLSPGSGVAGLFDLVLQVVNLGPADLRLIVDRILGPEFLQMIDRGVELGEKALEPVIILLKQGPLAFWDYIKESLESIIQSSFDRIKETVFFAFIEKGLKWIAGFFIPGGGFVKIVKAILSAFQFVADNLENIKHFFDSVFDSMEAAVSGDTEGVAKRIIDGLKMGVVMALDFLAKLLGLDKIVDQVQKIIQSLRRPIVKAIEWVLQKVKPLAMKLMRGVKKVVEKGKAAAGKVAAKVIAWWTQRKVFTTEEGEEHSLFFRGDGAAATLVVTSKEQTLETLLAAGGEHEKEIIASGSPAKNDALAKARKKHQDIKAAQAVLKSKPDDPTATRDMRKAFDALGAQLARMGVGVTTAADLPNTVITHSPDGNKAGSVTASPLSKKGSGGSGPDPNIVGWSHVLKIDSKNWERVHLVSEDFHGSGRFWNLVPARRTDNAWMREGPEKAIKTMLGKQMVLHYHVQVNGYHSLTDPVSGAAIEGFPESLSTSISSMKKEKGKWVRDVALSPFPTKKLAPPSLTGGKGVDLKTANHAALEALGIPRGVANNVMLVKPADGWTDKKHFQDVMQARYKSQRPPYDVNFKKVHWPAFDKLIKDKKAFF